MAGEGVAGDGAVTVYRPVSLRLPLPIWAAGNRQVTHKNKAASLIQPLPTWAAGQRQISSQLMASSLVLRTAWYVGGGVSLVSQRHGRIAGRVQVDGIPQTDKPVLLFYRPTLKLVASIQTDQNGAFAFYELVPEGRYLVLGLDDLAQSPSFNALVSDDVLPVSP